MLIRSAFRIVLSLCIGSLFLTSSFSFPAQAATSRDQWVVNQISQFNLPGYNQLPAEVATKMDKMSADPFAFYRGTAHLFYTDLKTRPASRFADQKTTQVWLDGDMHLQNFGAFRDGKGNFIFDVTDFDEAYGGSYLWDLQRMAVSILLAATEKQIKPKDRESLILTFLDSYHATLASFKGNDSEKEFQLTSNTTEGVVKDLIQKSEKATQSKFLANYTQVKNKQRRFKSDPNLQILNSSNVQQIQSAMSGYIQSISTNKRKPNDYYQLKDIRLKLGSGIGSLGRYRYYLLIEGETNSTKDDIIVEMKQALPSAVSIAAPNSLSISGSEADRVINGMKAMLSNTDPLAGFTEINGAAYSLREKSPYALDFDYLKMTSRKKFEAVIKTVGMIVAKIHAASDQDHDSTIIPYSQDKQISEKIDSDLAGFKKEVLSFTLDYAAQVELDYQSFKQAYDRQSLPFRRP